MATSKIHIHIVTFHSERYISKTLQALLDLNRYTLGENLSLSISDNHSSDKTLSLIRDFAEQHKGVQIIVNENNLGFCAGQNQGAKVFLDSDAEYLLILNPDIVLSSDFLIKIVEGFSYDSSVGAVTPLLLSTDEELVPLKPEIVDAAGMVLTSTIRHFDRFSGQKLSEHTLKKEYIFGGTGACLFVSRAFVEKVSFRAQHDEDVGRVYPELLPQREERPQLFDEAFFAFRDDADLALRAERLGFRYLFTPEAIGYHKRYVHHEKRKELPAKINALGVRNRFLLQLNNLRPWTHPHLLPLGFILRNVLVLFGVLLKERSSLSALKEVLLLSRRARRRYAYLR